MPTGPVDRTPNNRLPERRPQALRRKLRTPQADPAAVTTGGTTWPHRPPPRQHQLFPPALPGRVPNNRRPRQRPPPKRPTPQTNRATTTTEHPHPHRPPPPHRPPHRPPIAPTKPKPDNQRPERWPGPDLRPNLPANRTNPDPTATGNPWPHRPSPRPRPHRPAGWSALPRRMRRPPGCGVRLRRRRMRWGAGGPRGRVRRRRLRRGLPGRGRRGVVVDGPSAAGPQCGGSGPDWWRFRLCRRSIRGRWCSPIRW